MPPKPEWRSHARRREQPHLPPPEPHELAGALGGKGGETADVDGQSVLCLERVEPALPGRGITGPLEHPDPDRLEPAAGYVLLGVLRSHSQGRQRRPGNHPMPRQGMDEGLQFGFAGYTHGIFLARKSKYVQVPSRTRHEAALRAPPGRNGGTTPATVPRECPFPPCKPSGADTPETHSTSGALHRSRTPDVSAPPGHTIPAC